LKYPSDKEIDHACQIAILISILPDSARNLLASKLTNGEYTTWTEDSVEKGKQVLQAYICYCSKPIEMVPTAFRPSKGKSADLSHLQVKVEELDDAFTERAKSAMRTIENTFGRRPQIEARYQKNVQNSQVQINSNPKNGLMNTEESNQKYCICEQLKQDQMIQCDNENCRYGWFHMSCLSLKEVPEGNWYCPMCSLNFKNTS